MVSKKLKKTINASAKIHHQILVGPPKLTKFERTRIIGSRALQISMGAPLLVEPNNLSDPIDLALKEMNANVLPMTIRRRLPDSSYQDIPLSWLI